MLYLTVKIFLKDNNLDFKCELWLEFLISLSCFWKSLKSPSYINRTYIAINLKLLKSTISSLAPWSESTRLAGFCLKLGQWVKHTFSVNLKSFSTCFLFADLSLPAWLREGGGKCGRLTDLCVDRTQYLSGSLPVLSVQASAGWISIWHPSGVLEQDRRKCWVFGPAIWDRGSAAFY